MKLLVTRRCRPMRNLVLDLGIRGGGAAASAALPVSPVEDEQVSMVCDPEVGYIYYVGERFLLQNARPEVDWTKKLTN